MIKWQGYGDDENRWEFVENLNCPELIEAFEENLKQEGNLMTTSLYHNSNCACFLEADALSRKRKRESKVIEAAAKDARIRIPVSIIGINKEHGELNFLIKWKDDSASFVPAKEANIIYAPLVIEFYEKHLTLEH